MVRSMIPTPAADSRANLALKDRHVAFVGRLGGFNRREAQALVREHGGTPVDVTHRQLDLVVIGAEELSISSADLLDDELIDRATSGDLEVINETQLLEQLGLVDDIQNVQQHYTPSMLAELLGVPTATIRRWHRKGLILPVREVHRLPYFDFQEVITAQRLAQLLSAGGSPEKIGAKLQQMAKIFPDVDRPLAQLSVIVEGRDILLRDGEGLLDSDGQRRFDFEAIDSDQPKTDHVEEVRQEEHEPPSTLALPKREIRPPTIEELLEQAATWEAEGAIDEAINSYRSALMAGASSAEVHFLLAEALYRVEDVAGARERYYVALELDEDYVEARANLGCVLAETGQTDLAIAAFEGALARHPEYTDVLFHLARTLDEVGRTDDALQHWRAFLSLAPDSPWASEARYRLGLNQ